MRPDSIEIPPQPIKPDSVSRVNPSRQKEREERREDVKDQEENPPRGKRPAPADPSGPGRRPGSPPTGKSSTRGNRLDLLV